MVGNKCRDALLEVYSRTGGDFVPLLNEKFIEMREGLASKCRKMLIDVLMRDNNTQETGNSSLI